MLFDTSFTIQHVGYNVLTPEQTPAYDVRSSVDGYGMLFSLLGVGLGMASIAPPLTVFRVTRERHRALRDELADQGFAIQKEP